jgi:hypothetical protein
MERSKRIFCAAGYAKPKRASPIARSAQRAVISFDANDRVQPDLVDSPPCLANRVLLECCEVNLKRFCCDCGCE